MNLSVQDGSMQDVQDSIIKLISSYFAKDKRVVAVYLFGSHAAGKNYKHSDIDIAVLLQNGLQRPKFEDLALKFTCGLIKLLNENRIDILILNSAGPIARHQVFDNGRMIFCRNAKQAMRFKDLSISEYLDFLPFRRMSEIKMMVNIKRGGNRG